MLSIDQAFVFGLAAASFVWFFSEYKVAIKLKRRESVK